MTRLKYKVITEKDVVDKIWREGEFATLLFNCQLSEVGFTACSAQGSTDKST